MKRILAMLLAVCMLLSLAACSLAEEGVYYMIDSFSDNEKQIKKMLKETERTLDPQQIYANLDYNERMFYGEYVIENWDKNKKDFFENATFVEMEYCLTYSYNEVQTRTEELCLLPVGLQAGYASVYETRGNKDHEWALLTLACSTGGTRDVLCTYQVSGNTVSFTPVESYMSVTDENYKRIGFEYALGQERLEYTFSFSGFGLTLSRDGQSVTLLADDFSDNGSSYINIGGYLASDSQALEDIDWISASISSKYRFCHILVQDENIWVYDEAVALSEDGLISIYFKTRDEAGNEQEHFVQMVCFPGDGYVMTLTDGENFYYYTDNYTTREMDQLSAMVAEEDKAQLEQMEEEEIKEIAEKKNSLLDDLAKAYEEAGLEVTIDRNTGEIAMDSGVLFNVNESEISAEGKAFLQQFMQVYASVVFSDKYTDFVSKIMVEGHTDTDGDYEMNLELSQKRADGVLAYCLTEECGMGEHVQTLETMMEAVGYAYDKPVYDAEGNVDKDASRRVSFRFVINLG